MFRIGLSVSDQLRYLKLILLTYNSNVKDYNKIFFELY
jgi:hypothetical protein